MDFEDFKVYAPAEYKKFISNKYMNNHMTPAKIETSIKIFNAILVAKINRREVNYEK